MQNNVQIISHTIKSGDTLYNLAKHYNLTIDDIMQMNPGINNKNLQVGQVVFIPLKMKSNFEVNDKVLELSNLMRMLWEQHILWTRIVIQDIVYDLPELDFAVARLLRNPDDFGKALASFYGRRNAQIFASLLRDYLTIAADLVKAAKANDTIQVNAINQKWFNNADDIAHFLANANPFWSFTEWQQMLYNHLNLVKAEALNFLNNNLEQNVQSFDEMERQALLMADEFTRGIVQQFPDRFFDTRYYYY